MSALILFLMGLAGAEDLGVIWENNQAVELLQQEKPVDAYEKFLSQMSVSPENALLQFNVGTSLLANGEEQKAIELYEELLKKLPPAKDPQAGFLRFAALYNLGVIHGALKKVDKALEFYQQALEINPDSQEVKHNIELLIQSGDGKGEGGEGEDSSEGDSSEDKEPKDGENSDKDQDKPRTNKPQNKQKKFDESQMSKKDLKQILEELKRQEESIRAKIQGKNKKKGSDRDTEKPW